MATEPQDAAKASGSPSQTSATEGVPESPGGAKTPGAEPTDVAAQHAKLTTEHRDLNDRMLRLAAEFENYKRRSRKEYEDAGLRGLEGALKELLPPLDNLDRAIVAARAEKTAGSPALLEGVLLVQKQFLSALEKLQVKTFEAEGKPFDPNFHEAVQQVDSATLPAGSVATVYQRGYIHTPTSRLLRAAVVAVVRGKAEPTPASGDGAAKQPN